MCLVQGGHDIILGAFDNFKTKCSEPRRFNSLMKCFESETENIEFMVCFKYVYSNTNSVQIFKTHF